MKHGFYGGKKQNKRKEIIFKEKSERIYTF